MRKRIILIRNIFPNQYGGGESYQLELAQNLRENDLEPIIFSSSQKLLENTKQQKIKFQKTPYLKNQNWSSWRNLFLPIYICWQFRLYFWYKKQFRKINPIAVNIQSRDDWIAATLAAKKLNIKIFWTDHIDFRTWVLQNVNKKFKNPIGKYILKLAKYPKKIIMISDFEYKSFKKIIAPRQLDNLTVMKNGVKDEYNKYQDIKTEPQTFCYVGRLISYKGIAELITAFNIISREFPNAKLNIYGAGPDEEKYHKMANNKNIIFHGYTNEPLRAIAESEIFVLPSYYEGLSMSLLDAAMMQKTIIATDIDGNPEVVEDCVTGLLVPAKNSQKLAEAMQYSLKNPEKATQFAQNAHKKYEQEFNFKQTIQAQFLPLIKD